MATAQIPNHPKGNLVIIGGHEDKHKSGDREILSEIAKMIGKGKLVIATIASEVGEEIWKDYKKIFTDLGVEKLSHLHVETRVDAFDQKAMKAVEGAKGIFFTGGDQLRITAEMGGTEVCQTIHEIYLQGGVIAGTSAGASVMSDTMLVSGPSDQTAKSKKSVEMAPGLGFLREVIVDQHFAQRGRISRLMAAIALNPKFLGLGIDENTAVIFEKANEFRVLGEGAVYVLDGRGSTKSNISNAGEDDALSVHNMKVHVLSNGERFSVVEREPVIQKKQSEAHA